MKIGIESKGFDGWGGGIDFVRHVASCLEMANEEGLHELHLLLAKNDVFFHVKKHIQPFREVARSIIHREQLYWNSWDGFDEHYLKKTFSNFEGINCIFPGHSRKSHLSYAKKNKFDVLIPCTLPAPEGYPVPWVGYLYDFQHKYLPQFFTQRAIEARDYAFSKMLNCAAHVIVNAKSVKSDVDKFIGHYKAEVHVLPFSPSPKEKFFSENRELSANYGITKPYFIICNQFWIHKDHSTAIKAFAEFLRISGPYFQLVCTGDTHDSRFPDYFASLVRLIKELGVDEDIKILGHIPKLDQIALLKKSIAVIQPTLFEGGPGGGSAYDAISLGKALIISDISVNCEIQQDDRVFFFEVKNVKDLAQMMTKVSQLNFDVIDNKTLRAKATTRKKACGQFLLSVIDQAVDDYEGV